MKKDFKNPMKEKSLAQKASGLILMPIVTGGKKKEADTEDKSEDDEDEDISEEEALKQIAKQIKNFNSLLGEKADSEAIDALTKRVEDLAEALESKTVQEIEAEIKAINEGNAKLFKQVLELQEQLASEAQKDGGQSTGKKSLITKEAIESFVKQIYPKGKNGKKVQVHAEIEVKAAEEFGFNTFANGADVSAFTGRRIDPTLYEAPRKTNLILDFFNIPTIDVPTLIYLRKIEVGVDPDADNSGSAEWIACGTPKPRRSFRLTTGEVDAKKVAIFNTIDDCLLQDVPSTLRWIREDFVAEMKEAINSGLLSGNPEVNELLPLGLKTNAVQFDATQVPAFDNTIPNPNYIDALFAVIAFMAVNRETPSMAFVSKDVYYAIHALKSTSERWLNNNLVYTDNLGRLYIAGVLVVGVDAEDVPSTHVLLIGAETGFKIYAYGDMVIETGLNGQDFREDKTSIRGYQRFLSFIPEDRENSVLYDTWENIFLGIEAPAEVPAG